jgi:hypothetical protein
MCILLEIPEILSVQILSNWLNDEDVINFDSAVCCKELRVPMLSLLTHSCMFLHSEKENSPFAWTAVRRIKLSVASLNKKKLPSFISFEHITSLRLKDLRLSLLSEFDFFRIINEAKSLDHVLFFNLECFTPESIRRISPNFFNKISECHIETKNCNAAQEWSEQLLGLSCKLLEFSISFENSVLDNCFVLGLLLRNHDLEVLNFDGSQFGSDTLLTGLCSDNLVGVGLLELSLNCFIPSSQTLNLVVSFLQHYPCLKYLDISSYIHQFHVLYEMNCGCSFLVESYFDTISYDQSLLCILDQLTDLVDISIFNSGLGKDILLKIKEKFCHSLKYARLHKNPTSVSEDVFGLSELLETCISLKTIGILNSTMTDEDFFILSTVPTSLAHIMISDNDNITDRTIYHWCDMCDKTLESFLLCNGSTTRSYRPFFEVKEFVPGPVWPY